MISKMLSIYRERVQHLTEEAERIEYNISDEQLWLGEVNKKLKEAQQKLKELEEGNEGL